MEPEIQQIKVQLNPRLMVSTSYTQEEMLHREGYNNDAHINSRHIYPMETEEGYPSPPKVWEITNFVSSN